MDKFGVQQAIWGLGSESGELMGVKGNARREIQRTCRTLPTLTLKHVKWVLWEPKPLR